MDRPCHRFFDYPSLVIGSQSAIINNGGVNMCQPPKLGLQHDYGSKTMTAAPEGQLISRLIKLPFGHPTSPLGPEAIPPHRVPPENSHIGEDHGDPHGAEQGIAMQNWSSTRTDGGFPSHRVTTPSHHPFLGGIFHDINHPAIKNL